MFLKSLRGNSKKQTRRHLHLEALEARVVPVNPINVLPSPQSMPRDTTLEFSVANGNKISVTDPDGPGPFEIELNSTNGTALVTAAGSATVTGNGTATAKIIGSLADVNATLSVIRFTPTAGFSGGAILQVESDDLNGAGGTTDTDNLSINVTGPNQNPVNNKPGTQTMPQGTTLVFSAANGNQISVTDTDGPGPYEVELNSTNGIATVTPTGASLTVTGNGTATAKLIGTLTDVNATLANIIFTPGAGFTGNAILQVESDDQNGSGGTSDTDNITINVTPAFLVTNTNNSGAGSLRQAIIDANNHVNVGGPDSIVFNISGTGVHIIQPTTPLPDITDPVVIDGSTQAGASANTLPVGNNAVMKIVINGDLAGQSNGLVVDASNCTIRGLVINGFDAGTSAGRGIVVQGVGHANNVIAGNFIGTNAAGTAAVPNEGDGIVVIDASGTRIGGANPADRNVIAFNGKNGVLVQDKTAVGNRFQGNSIFENGALGIDLGNNGVTANDATDADVGANTLQNTPVLTNADILAAKTTISGKLTSVANKQFRVELFSSAAADPSGFGEGQNFLGFVDVTTSKTGVALFVFDHPALLAGGTAVTATATRLDTGDTSEFSKILGAAVPNIKPNSYVYQDQDGDTVTISFSKPILNGQTIDKVLKFTAGTAIDFATIKRQLQTIDLTGLADPQAAKGTTISFTATRSATNGGDGFANVGFINANGIDLGHVTIDGDLGRLTAGDATQTTTGLAGLKAQSMGRFGTTTQNGGNLTSRVFGKLGSLSIFSDFVDGNLEADGFGSILLGGSLIGGTAANSGRFDSNLAVGSITVRGNIVGAGGTASGSIHVGESVGTVNIGGSVLGGPGQASGQLDFSKTVNAITIGRNLVGNGGLSSGKLTLIDVGNLVIGGSVIGGAGQFAGAVSLNKLTTGRILGDLLGGTGFESGAVVTDSIGSLTIGGDVRSSTGDGSGSIYAVKRIGSVTINGSVAGTLADPVFMQAGGQDSPVGSTDVVIGSVNVKGSVIFAKIVAGLAKNFTSVNADAQIGGVTVGGDWLASSIAAGVRPVNNFFGDGDDVKATGGQKDDPNLRSKIASLTIGGQALGTATAAGDVFGILAETIGAVRIGGTPLVLAAGNSNDDFFVGVSGDLKLREI